MIGTFDTWLKTMQQMFSLEVLMQKALTWVNQVVSEEGGEQVENQDEWETVMKQ